MTKLVIENALSEKLQRINHGVELCDSTGRTVGHFLPEAEYLKVLYERAKRLFTDEQLDHARRQGGGKSLAEILERLGAP